MTTQRRALGKRGEDAACDFLARKDYHIVERNWKCSYGEADIVATEADTLVFVEVKTRRSVAAGTPVEAVTPKKQQRYLRLAQLYVRRNNILDKNIRFDVISIHDHKNGRAELNLVKNAFGESGCL
ncbi:MAG: YraN family protein [Actinomycetes bacterium]|jgi:putative endonuclease|nr:YraN family protein [Actinomycetes bacterium]